ncbi:MAG: twin transmembrane helix small protein [Gammaproteobacteria bacterium]|nr:twin transmembrane helix small protein [Gammaproteobacteria bacterium]
MKLFVILVLLGIVYSMGSALYFLMKDKEDGQRVLRALTIRVALSVFLFLLLVIAYVAGLVQPTGLPAGPHSP